MYSSNWSGQPSLALLGGIEEDRFTTYLAQLLQSETLLEAMLRNACGISVSPPDLHESQVSTQLRVIDGRPDLVIELPRHVIVVEAKVRSRLHVDQLVPYARHLQELCCQKPDLTPHLLILAPAAALSDAIQFGQAQLATAGLSTITLKGASWEQLAAEFLQCSERIPADEYRLRCHVEDFQQLVNVAVGLLNSPLSAEDVECLRDPVVAKALVNVSRLVESVIGKLRERHSSINWTPRSASKCDFIGYDILEKRAWFGIWFLAWGEFGSSPLWLDVRDLELRLRPAVAAQGRMVRQGGSESFVLPIGLAACIDPDDLSAAIADQIVALIG